MHDSGRPLLFNIATNGFASIYQEMLASHQAYGERYGFAVVSVTRPIRITRPAVAAWLKITLIREALQAGYPYIAYIDADCFMRMAAPDFRTCLDDEATVLMAKGRSHRWNSGVIFVRNTSTAHDFFDAVLASAEQNIPDEHRAHLKYENGNVIAVAESFPIVSELPLEWNNTYEPDLNDYIRHYTGPLRSEMQVPMRRKVLRQIIRLTVRKAGSAPEARDAGFVQDLQDVTSRVTRKYPAFSRA